MYYINSINDWFTDGDAANVWIHNMIKYIILTSYLL